VHATPRRMSPAGRAHAVRRSPGPARVPGAPGRPPGPRRRRVLGLLPAVLLLVVTGACGGLDRASAAGVSSDDLVSEMADRVAAAQTLSWTAVYRLAGGVTGRIAHDQAPARVAYAYPGGHLIRTPEALTRCDRAGGEIVCTATDPLADDGLPATTGLVTPAAVLSMLEAAAIDPDLAVTSRETTIAGRHASCLELGGAERAATPDFEVCVTVEGTIAAFTGTVTGTTVEMVMTDYRAGAAEPDFVVPPGARLVDRRPA
jgi:hypothetical protein